MEDKQIEGCTCQASLKKRRIWVCSLYQPDADVFDSGDCRFLFLENYLYRMNCCFASSLFH